MRPPIADLALAQRDGHTAGGPIPPNAMLRRRGIATRILGAVARRPTAPRAARADRPTSALPATAEAECYARYAHAAAAPYWRRGPGIG